MKVVKVLRVHIEIASSYFGTSYIKKAWWHFNPSRLLQAFWTELLATKKKNIMKQKLLLWSPPSQGRIGKCKNVPFSILKSYPVGVGKGQLAFLIFLTTFLPLDRINK